MPHPGVKHTVGEVGQQVCHQHGHRQKQYERLHRGIVPEEDRVDDQPTHARDRKDRLEDHHPADHRAHLQTEDGHHRQQRVAQRVPDHHRMRREALRARGRHVLLVHHFEHRRAHVAHQHRGDAGAERHRRHHHQPHVGTQVLGWWDVAARRQQAQAGGEQLDQQDAEKEVWDRHAAQRQHRRQHVDERAWLQRRNDPDRYRHDQRDQDPKCRQLNRRRDV